MLKPWGRKCLSPVIKCQVYQSCYAQFCIAGLQDSSTEAPTMLHKTLGGPLDELTALTQIPIPGGYIGALLPTPPITSPQLSPSVRFAARLAPALAAMLISFRVSDATASSSSPYRTLIDLYVTYKNTYMLTYMCIATYRPMPICEKVCTYMSHICAFCMGFSVAYSEFELANVEKLCIQVCRHQSQNWDV